MNTESPVLLDASPLDTDDWKLAFIGEKAREGYSKWVEETAILIANCQQQGTTLQERLDTLCSLRHILLQIRDKIIGNSCCKYFFVRQGLVNTLLPLLWLRDESNAAFTQLVTDCQQDALTLLAVMIGQSGESELSVIPAPEIFVNLLQLLHGATGQVISRNIKFYEILVRCLASFARKVESIRNLAFDPANLSVLLFFLDPTNSSAAISQHVAGIISSSCDSPPKQKTLLDAKVHVLLLALLNGACQLDATGRVVVTDLKIVDGAVDFLCTLTRDCPEAGHFIAASPLQSATRKMPALLFQLLNLNMSSVELKLKVALLLCNMYRQGTIKAFLAETQTVLLGFLVGLVDGVSDHSIRATYLVAFLVSEDEALQNVAIQMNVLNLVLKTLAKSKTTDSVFYEKRLESVLLMTASLSSTNEDCRKHIVDSRLLVLVVEALSADNVGIKIAACQCARNLSRSVKNLRTNLFDAGVARPLLTLLNDNSVIVQTTACATLCNMVLEFTPIRKVIINEGGIGDLVKLVSHPDAALRVNAIWSLKNLLYHSDNETRAKVLSLLSFDLIVRLLDEDNELVQEQTLNLIRNIGCGRQENIDDVFKGFGTARFINMLETKLQTKSAQIVLQTLYIIVNVATGSELHKSRIMESSIMIQCIMNYLGHDSPKIRLAAVWSLINLTWPNEPGFTERSSFLIQMGALKLLKSLQNDPDYDVRQKVSCAVANFTAAQ